MKFYFAPMEGITGYIYRNAHAKFFHQVDDYFIPFIAPTYHGRFTTRELQDIEPMHNQNIKVIPQVLTNNADDFNQTAWMLKKLGYEEVNLNLGCPSGTVVSKNKGSGFLSEKEALNRFFETVFAQTEVKISVKTRIGREAPEEFYDLIQIFNQYPLKKLIIHPRVQKDYYKNTPNLEIFKMGMQESKNKVCYNGDLFTAADYEKLLQECPDLEEVMLGRGLLCNPGLIETIKTGQLLDKDTFKAFHDELYTGYQEVMSGDRNVLFKMKEAWFYMIYMFSNHEKYAKKIRKAQKCVDYEAAVNALFEEQELVKGAGMFFTPEA